MNATHDQPAPRSFCDDSAAPIPPHSVVRFFVVQTESRGLFGRRTTYDNPWAPGVTDKSFRDLTKVLRTEEMGAVPTEQEKRQDLPLAEVRCLRRFCFCYCCCRCCWWCWWCWLSYYYCVLCGSTYIGRPVTN